MLRASSVFALTVLTACSGSSMTARATTQAFESPDVLPDGGSSSPAAVGDACPSGVDDADGRLCNVNGQICTDASGESLECFHGLWRPTEMHHPPCCKK